MCFYLDLYFVNLMKSLAAEMCKVYVRLLALKTGGREGRDDIREYPSGLPRQGEAEY